MTRLDLKAIGEYSQAFSQKLCNDFFLNKDTISGAEILNISTVDQVNLFAIKDLFETWKATTESFKSPYFDFENEKVKAALKDFMNVTSQHIAVKKADFLPILTKAAADTLTITLNPSDYFDTAFRNLPDFKCTQNDLASLQKYTRINASILEEFAQKLGDEPSVFTNVALKWLEEIAQNSTFDNADTILDQFNSTLGLNKNQFYKNNKIEESTAKVNENTSFFDNISKPEAKEIEMKQDVVEPIAPVLKEVESTSAAQEEEGISTFNDQYQSSELRLNDHLKSDDQNPTLADLHKNTPIKNISGSISLNQKFIFINKLFSGDSAAYNETIDILEKCKDSDEALNLLKYKYAPKYQWNLNSDEADELMDILKRKL